MRYVTAMEMKEIDRNAIEDCGIPAKLLMENAGKAVAEEAAKLSPKGEAIVFSGFGNNGGDGLVAARYLAKKGYGIKLFFVGKPKSFTPETNSNLESLLSLKVEPKFISSETEIDKALAGVKPSIIIDAIFGIGIKGSLNNFYVRLIEHINALGSPIVAVDIPSGLDADTGNPTPAAIKAAVTVTFGYPKTGFKNEAACSYIGRLIVADIGFPDASTENTPAKDKTIRLRSGKRGAIKSGHPWIFKARIMKAAFGINPGDIVTIQTDNGKFVGRGYYNPRSDISVRLLTFNSGEAINGDFFFKRFEDAINKRSNLKSTTNAFRVVFSEADGLPGLIVDMYNDTVVFQVHTLGMDRLKSLIIEAIEKILKPRYIYEKSESPFRKLEGLKDVKMWHGDNGINPIEVFEGKAKFLVDIENGHKTGFYLDQRKSRLGLENFCKDKTVLDLFCYTGPFSVSAALYGARSVEGIDIKDKWLELARENAGLNAVSDRCKFVKADAFDALNDILASGRKFDIIICDPPSFLKTRESLASASKGYGRLNTLAMKALAKDGMLATFSCSHNMPNESFSGIIKTSSAEAGKKITILKRCHQAEDHPIIRSIPETEYLKGYFLKVGDV